MKIFNRVLKKYISSIIILTILTIVCFRIYDDLRKTTSLIEAYKIAYNAVYEKNSRVLLIHLTSADSMYHPEDSKAGANGRRRYWNLSFTVPNISEGWIVQIKDRKIKNIVKVSTMINNTSILIDDMEHFIDSKEALKIAKRKYHLKPGEGWAIGYHFTMDKSGGIIIIDVVGRDNQNNFSRISINAKTKEIVNAIHKVPIGDGKYQWEKFDKETNP